MNDYEKFLGKLLQTHFELSRGTYKRKSNKEILEDFNNDYERMKKMNNENWKQIKQTCTTDCQVGKTNKLFNNEMKPIKINEMTLGITYKKRYIKLEIFTKLILMTSIMFLGKDDNGDLALIAIYNFENYFKTKSYNKLSKIFQEGKYILVLEPFYKMFGSGEDGIRIEDPNEIILFDNKEWIDKFLYNQNNENFDFLYKEGNNLFENGQYNEALAHFIKVKSFKSFENEIELKIAECYFKLPYYSKAIEQCNEILNNNENNINAIILKIKSLIHLQKIYEAKKLFNSKKDLIEIEKEKEFNNLKEEINNKIKNIKGEFNFKDLYEQSKNSLNLNIGEYVNQKLKIHFEKNKGISVYTKEKIKKGELLVVSKALAISKINENKEEIIYDYDNPSKEEFEKTGQLLIIKKKEKLQEILSYKLSNYPEDYKEFLKLYDGKNINLNLEKRKKKSEICLTKIQDVIQYNSLLLSINEKPISNGLWFYPSFFNHSCIPNCYYFGFGDILIIISVNDIEPNTELFLNYLENGLNFEKRQKILKEKYNFICNCQLCQYEKKQFNECKEKKILDDYFKKLDEISQEKNIIAKNKKEIEKMEEFVENNKKIFSCYEKNIFYLKSADCMSKYDFNISYEYLVKALRYCENRNYYFEKITLLMMNMIVKLLQCEEKIRYFEKKRKSFLETYFNEQKGFFKNLIMNI